METSGILLYPTETIYGLGANVFDDVVLSKLFELKRRDESQTASWLVRGVADIERYAEMSEMAHQIAAAFLPGPLTLVLLAREIVPERRKAPDNTVGVRVSSDPVAQQVIADFMAAHDAPLTCTSANVSGQPTMKTPEEILKQFGSLSSMIDTVVDDCPRKGLASTVVKVVGDDITIIREGAISEADIRKALR